MNEKFSNKWDDEKRCIISFFDVLWLLYCIIVIILYRYSYH